MLILKKTTTNKLFNNFYFTDLNYSLILLISLAISSFFVFHRFILGDAVYLFTDIGSDTINYSYPNWVNISRILTSGEIPGWSFEKGMGQNIFPFSFNDPSSYPLYFFNPKTMPYAIIWIEILKINLSGIIFFNYLKKINISDFSACLGGLLYAFSGFMVIGSSWYIFSTIGLYVALMLLSFEILYQDNKWWILTLSVTLVSMLNPVNLYTCFLFLFIYSFYRSFTEGASINLIFYKRFILSSTLGLLLSSVVSLPTLLQMIDSPRSSGEASLINYFFSMSLFEPGEAKYLITAILRTLSNDILGNGNSFTGWSNYLEAPAAYCGLISMLLFTQRFFLFGKKVAVYSSLFLGLFIFSEIFPWFRRAFWLFTGDYFREFSLFISVILIQYALSSLDLIIKLKKINWIILFLTLFFFLFLLYFPYQAIDASNTIHANFYSAVVDENLKTRILLYLLFFIVLLFLITRDCNIKKIKFLLFSLLFIELLDFSYMTVNERHSISSAQLNQRINYNDYTIEAVSYIKEIDKSIYRIDKNYSSVKGELPNHHSLNDGMVYNYLSTTAYTSFNQINYINFLRLTEAIDQTLDKSTRWSIGVVNDPFLAILVGVKYFLFSGELPGNDDIVKNLYDEIGKVEDIHILKSKYALPMGVAYDKYMLESDFLLLSKYQKHISLFKALVIPDGFAKYFPTMQKITYKNIPSLYSFNELDFDIIQLLKYKFNIDYFSNNLIRGTITSDQDQLLFFSFPFDKGWLATVNGGYAPLLLVNGGLTAIPIKKGLNTISLAYNPPYLKTGLSLSLLGIFIFLFLVVQGRLTKKMHASL